MATVELREVTKRFGDDEAVLSSVDLSVNDGEFMVLIGPSGCGKTTVLRLIAGLENPTSGEVLIGGEVVNRVATQQRNVAMVFQENALFPFMSVERNVAFPLAIARVPEDERTARVLAEARVHDLESLLHRMPGTLSAGYQQLVQMAREMVRVPRVFLMDEPLARLDAAQRVRMRGELALLQRGFGVTTLYVTPDPAEAMALGDRVAVLDAGGIQQLDDPRAIYRRPANRFVAEFFAPFPMNLVAAGVSRGQQGFLLDLWGGRLPAWAPAVEHRVGDRVLVGVRPEHVVRADDAPGEPAFEATVERVEFLGDSFAIHLGVGRSSLLMTAPEAPAVGGVLTIALPQQRVHLFDPDTGVAIGHPL